APRRAAPAAGGLPALVLRPELAPRDAAVRDRAARSRLPRSRRRRAALPREAARAARERENGVLPVPLHDTRGAEGDRSVVEARGGGDHAACELPSLVTRGCAVSTGTACAARAVTMSRRPRARPRISAMLGWPRTCWQS